jgi:hypothetical protein
VIGTGDRQIAQLVEIHRMPHAGIGFALQG